MLCSLSFAIGAVAGLVGVGGGEFLVPMFLSLGFSHQKSSATSSCLISLAMLTDAISYLRGGELQASAHAARSKLLCAIRTKQDQTRSAAKQP